MKKIYYIVCLKVFLFLSISLFAQPTNDNCGMATSLTQNATCNNISATTLNATDSGVSTALCTGTADDDVWFQFTATTANPIIEVNGSAGFDAVVEVFSGTCAALSSVACEDNQLAGGTEIVSLTGLTIGNTYFIRVFDWWNIPPTSFTFDICVHDAGTGTCTLGSNNECITPETISVTTGSAPSCATSCNDGATPGPDFTGNNGCFDLPNETVWFEVTTDAASDLMNIDVTSSDITFPIVAVYTSNDCLAFNQISCNSGNGGTVNISNLDINSNTNYLIAISTNNASVGSFDICIETTANNSACNTDATLVENSSSDPDTPVGGPYSPGETVEFCYTINGYGEGSDANCNYLSGVVPEFGNCWDPSSFGPQGQPLNITVPLTTQGFVGIIQFGLSSCEFSPAGTWSWYPAGSVDYNVNNPLLGLNAGDPLPAGWFFVTNYDSWEYENNGIWDCDNSDHNDPDESYGDFDLPGCPNDPFLPALTWNVCFELTTRDIDDCSSNTDCELSIRTYADGEIGVWDDVGCTEDVPQVFNASLNCCIPPTVVNQTDDICEDAEGSNSNVVNLTLYENDIYSSTTATFVWYEDAGLTTLVPTSNSATVTAPSTTFWVEITEGGCFSITMVTISVNALPTANDLNEGPLCENPPGSGMVSGIDLTALNSSIGSGTINWFSDATLTTPVSPANNVTVSNGTQFYAQVIDPTTNCENVGVVNYTVVSVPTVPTATSPPPICEGDAVPDLTATAGSGGTLTWYDDAALTNQVGTGSPFASGISNASAGTFDFWVTETVSGCESTGTQATITINAAPAAPTANSPAAICVGDAVPDLTATAGSGGTLTWYDDAALTSQVGTGSPFASGISNASAGTFDFWVTETVSGCESTGTQVTITINAIPTAPAATSPAAICIGDAVPDLTATAGSGGTLTWYDDAALTSQVGTGSPFASGISNASAGTFDFWVTETVSGCESTGTQVTITINAAPAAPTATSPAAICVGDAVPDLTATAGSGGTLTWYDDAALTNQVGTGSPFASGVSSASSGTFDFWVTETVSGCESTGTQVTITINAAPAAPTATSPAEICVGDAVPDLTATAGSGGTLTWYDDAALTNQVGTGSPFASGASNASAGTFDFWVTETVSGCESTGTQVTITINAIPTAPAATSPAAICIGDAVPDLTATAGSGGTLTWYDDAALTSQVGTGSPFASGVSSVSSGTFNFWVTETVSGCESTGTQVTITINAAPSAPTATSPAEICVGDAVPDLTATAGSGGTLTWYDDAALTNQVGTGSPFASGISNASAGTFNFWVTETEGSCESTGTQVTITINAAPAAPTANSPAEICVGDAVPDLTATGSGGTLTWYDDAALTSQVGTGSPFASGVSSASSGTFDFWVTETVSGCESTGTQVTITINAAPAAPTATSPAEICVGDAVPDLTATGSGGTLTWYDDAALTSQVGTGSPFASGISNTSAGTFDFWVTETVSGCESTGTQVTITINAAPAAPTANSPAAICVGDAVPDLTASGSGGTLTWYDDDALTNQVGTGSPFASGVSNASAGTFNFWVTETVSGCESTGTQVTITINAAPAAPIATSPAAICVGDAVPDLTATAGSGGTLTWYDDAALTSQVGTGSPFASGASNASAGTFDFWVTETVSGCESTGTQVTITINAAPNAGTPSSETLCSDNTSPFDLNTLLSGQDLGGTWTETSVPLSTGFNAINQTFTADGQAEQTYTFEYTVTGPPPCADAVSEVSITVVAPPSATIDPLTATVCNGATGSGPNLNLDDYVTGDTGIWADTDGSGASGTMPDLDFTGVTPGNYTFTYTTNTAVAPCTDQSYTLQVIVQDCSCPSVALIVPPDLCSDAGILNLDDLLDVSVTEPGTWTIESTPQPPSTPAFIEGDGITFNGTNADAGAYVIRFTLNNTPPTGCPEFAEQTINIYAPPYAGEDNTLNVCNNTDQTMDLFTLLGGAPDIGGTWTLNTSSDVPDVNAFDNTNGIFNPLEHSSGTFIFDYELTATPPCQNDVASLTIIVDEMPTAQLDTPPSLCNTTDGGSIIDLSTLIISESQSGTWSDTDNAAGAGASVNFPNIDFNGVVPNTYTFTYTIQSILGNCPPQDFTITINVEDCECPSLTLDTPPVICSDESLDVSTLQVTTEVGTWSITSTPSGSNPASIDADGITFNSNNGDEGDYELTFTLSTTPPPGCEDNNSITVSIAQAGIADWTSPGTICDTENAFDLNTLLNTNATIGGNWTIDGNAASNFDPTSLGAGTYVVSYTVGTDPCADSNPQDIVVIGEANANWNVPVVCSNDAAFDLNTLLDANATTNGTWTIDGTAGNNFDPMSLGEGTYNVVYSVGTAPCDASLPQDIVVTLSGIADWTAPTDICTGDAAMNLEDWLAANATSGGTWTVDGNTTTTFDPATLGNGPHEVIYSVGTPPCDDSNTQNVFIDALPNADWTLPIGLCENDNAIDLDDLLDVTATSGGTWTIDGNPATNLDPTVLGDGAYTLVYTVGTTPCEKSNEQVLNILAQPTSDFTATTPICITEVSTIEYTGTASDNANFNWNFNGGTPANVSGPGPHEISWATAGDKTITLTVEENGCTSQLQTETVNISNPLPNPVINCNTTTNEITFTWDDVPGASGYTVTIDGDNVTPNGNSYTISGLNPGDNATIVVEAIGDGICENSSAELECTAQDCPEPTISIDPVDDICLDINVATSSLTANISNSAGTGTLTWTGTGIIDETMVFLTQRQPEQAATTSL